MLALYGCLQILFSAEERVKTRLISTRQPGGKYLKKSEILSKNRPAQKYIYETTNENDRGVEK